MTGLAGSPPATNVEFRRAEARDADLVRRAHVAHRIELLGGAAASPAALAALCAQQHDLQERHIATHHPDADMLMIDVAGQTAGRLCVDRDGDRWRIVDLVILPERQRRGVGSTALRLLLMEAAHAGATVDLHVGRDNRRAESLYRREGFVDAAGGTATHRRLACEPRIAAIS